MHGTYSLHNSVQSKKGKLQRQHECACRFGGHILVVPLSLSFTLVLTAVLEPRFLLLDHFCCIISCGKWNSEPSWNAVLCFQCIRKHFSLATLLLQHLFFKHKPFPSTMVCAHTGYCHQLFYVNEGVV